MGELAGQLDAADAAADDDEVGGALQGGEQAGLGGGELVGELVAEQVFAAGEGRRGGEVGAEGDDDEAGAQAGAGGEEDLVEPGVEADDLVDEVAGAGGVDAALGGELAARGRQAEDQALLAQRDVAVAGLAIDDRDREAPAGAVAAKLVVELDAGEARPEDQHVAGRVRVGGGGGGGHRGLW